jgi:hypothetical protein
MRQINLALFIRGRSRMRYVAPIRGGLPPALLQPIFQEFRSNVSASFFLLIPAINWRGLPLLPGVPMNWILKAIAGYRIRFWSRCTPMYLLHLSQPDLDYLISGRTLYMHFPPSEQGRIHVLSCKRLI